MDRIAYLQHSCCPACPPSLRAARCDLHYMPAILTAKSEATHQTRRVGGYQIAQIRCDCRQSLSFCLHCLQKPTRNSDKRVGRKAMDTAPLPVSAGWMRWCVVCGIAVVIPTLLQARWGLGWVTLHWMSWTCPPPASCTHGHHGLGVSVVVQASRRCNIGWPIKYPFGDGCRFSCYYQEKCCKIDASVTHHLPLRAPWLAAGRKGKDIGTVHVHPHHRQKTQNDGPPVDEYTPQSGFHRSVAGRFSYIRQVTRSEPMI